MPTHPFYALPRGLQHVAAVVLFALAVAPPLLVFRWPLLVLAAQLMASWGFFATTPLLRAVGFYRYYSPFLCAMVPTRRRLDIHLGTTFDHALTVWRGEPGRVARNRVLVGALDGLLAIAGEVEAGRLPEAVRVEGTSWFFTERAAQRLGFELARPTWLGRLIPFVIALDITAMASVTQGQLTLPRVHRVHRAVTTGARLLARRSHLEALRDRLARDLPARPALTTR